MNTAATDNTLVLIRYGEIGLKGRNRPEFERRLAERVRLALKPLGGRVWREHGRLFAEAPVSWPELQRRLAGVFGIVSFSPVRRAPLDLDAIIAGARAELADALEDRRALTDRRAPADPHAPAGRPPGPARFKVAARRANKRFPLRSIELNRQIGAALLADPPGGRELQVALDDPEHTVHVEIRDDAAYIFARTAAGPGGLPVGSSGRALALLSGGIDSPAAVWMIMKRGVRVDAVHFHSYPFTSDRSKEKVIDLARILAKHGGPIDLHVVHFTDVQTAISQACPPEWVITIMRRMMFRIAGRLAGRIGALALVTGESVGQVASQTLESIQTIGAVAPLPVLRPLVGFDKAEIVDLARRIGTYDTSILPYQDCCALFVPRNPRTRPRPAEAEAVEAPLEIEPLITGALERTETLRLDP